MATNMRIYKIYQIKNNDYDTYDSAIVVADDEKEARTINPGGFYSFHDDAWYFQFADGTENNREDMSWVHPNDVKVKYIGLADKKITKGVIVSSFNAG